MNAEYKTYEMDDNGLFNETPIIHYTPLYKAMQYFISGDAKISLICKLLEAGADPTILTHDSDNPFKLALRHDSRLLVPNQCSSLCSYLLKQDSLISLFNIAFFTLESLRTIHKIPCVLTQNNQTEGWKPNTNSLVEHVNMFRDEIRGAKGTERETWQKFINRPGKLYKSLEAIKNFSVPKRGLLSYILNEEVDKTSWVAKELLGEPFQSCLHDSLSSMRNAPRKLDRVLREFFCV